VQYFVVIAASDLPLHTIKSCLLSSANRCDVSEPYHKHFVDSLRRTTKQRRLPAMSVCYVTIHQLATVKRSCVCKHLNLTVAALTTRDEARYWSRIAVFRSDILFCRVFLSRPIPKLHSTSQCAEKLQTGVKFIHFLSKLLEIQLQRFLTACDRKKQHPRRRRDGIHKLRVRVRVVL